MIHREPARATPRRIPRVVIAGLLFVVSVIAAAFGAPILSTSTAATRVDVPRGGDTGPPIEHIGRRGGPRVALGEEDGVVPEGTTVFDGIPGVAKLDPDLLGALRRVATDGAHEGIVLLVDSGWRSPRYQTQLRREAVSKYGSGAEAARWVATADTSPHAFGDAVDIGPLDAMAWLSEHGARYGLCQIFANEPWHYELRPRAIDRRCPRMYADPTHDPRMQPSPRHQ